MKNPLVSIVIPYYNGEVYFKELLESLDAQTVKDVETVIVNDKSTLGSYKILKELATQYPKLHIKIHNNSKNKGAAISRSNGLLLSRGKYIVFIDPDDTLCGKYSLEYRVNFLEKNHKFSGISGYDVRMDENGILFQRFDKKTKFFREGMKNPEGLRKIYAMNAIKNTGLTTSVSALFFASGSSMFRREDIKDLLFNPEYEFEEDIEWTLRLLEKRLIKLEMIPFFCRRVHKAQYHDRAPLEVIEKVIKICEKALE